MGIVVSAIATGLVQNVERDFVKQPVENENQSIDKPVDEETIICKPETEEKESVVTPGFPTIKLDIEPLHNDGHLNKQNKSKSKHKKVVKDPPPKTKLLAVRDGES